MMEREDSIRIAGIVRESIVDGPGIRFVIFCQGCPHHCQGCHNETAHDFDGGYLCGIDKILNAIDENPLLDGVTFSGGEPACQPKGFLILAKELRKRNLHIMMYSGYTFEELYAMAQENEALRQLLESVDILVDGRYEAIERDLTLSFRGSRNQRVIDMKKAYKMGEAAIAENF